MVIVQPIAKGMVDMLNAQDGLYHVNLQGIDKGQAVDSIQMIDVINGGSKLQIFHSTHSVTAHRLPFPFSGPFGFTCGDTFMLAPAIPFADCEISADFYASFDVFMVFETIPIIIYHIEDTVRMRVVFIFNSAGTF